MKIGILTSGGLAPCLSSAIAYIIDKYTKVSPETEIICYLNGYRGLLIGEKIIVSKELRENAHKLHSFGGSPIGNSRVRLKNVYDCVKRGLVKPGESPEHVAAMQLIKDEITILHTIGGDDTNMTAGDLSIYLKQNFDNYKLNVLGLPKTIDNDVFPISQTLGCQTAAEQGAIFFKNVVSEHSSNPRMLIIHEVMGRNCGWLAAKTAEFYMNHHKINISGIIDIRKIDIHAVYIPEIDINIESESKRLKKVMDKIGCVNIFISEGAGIDEIIREKKRKNEKIEYDPFGHIKLDSINPGNWFSKVFSGLIKAEKILVQKSGYFCRAAPANEFDKKLISDSVDFAVECAINGRTGLIGHDSENHNKMSCIDYHRVSGKKPFDPTVKWFSKLLKDINQPLIIKTKKEDTQESKNIDDELMKQDDNSFVSISNALITVSKSETSFVKDLLEKAGYQDKEINYLSKIVCNLMAVFKSISKDCKKSGSLSYEKENSYENYKTINLLANKQICSSMKFTKLINRIISSESNKVIDFDWVDNGYDLVIDALDGCSNINANISVGTIFGIYNSDKLNYLPKGKELIISGYCLYGSATMMMVTFGKRVYGFTLDISNNNFVLSHKDLRIPDTGNYYSVNEGYWLDWDKSVHEYIKKCQEDKKSLRYVGSMVADIHRTILYGGIFMYPRNHSWKDGKLRLVYECNPIAFLIENAGGKASTGKGRILDVEPKSISQQVETVVGSKLMVEEFENMKE